MQAIIDSEVEELVAKQRYRTGNEPVELVGSRHKKKRTGKIDSVDFRRVNKVTESDVYPLPQITIRQISLSTRPHHSRPKE